ncbi:MAG: DUF58 domain-containing protein [Pirellulaceae bacterium]|jgi:uncharacterized protein (DUF58 family)|nr:DUF58 domain-containing protein [Pirellulaceae bacterium]MDP7018804.1 DUF58 domain-containing protein [Pirellulaceae bacterium]
MVQDDFNLLDPELLEQARALRIVARRVAPAGRWAEHRSRDRGQGLEFQDYRPYSPGDELRAVDWNIYRRLGRVVIRLFEEMEDLPIYLLPDLSFSMWQEAADPRAVVAMKAAIGLAAIGLDQHDRVGVFPFGEELEVGIRPMSGRSRLTAFAQALTQSARDAQDRKSGTDLAAAMSRFRGLGLRQGLVVVVSDFLDPRGAAAVLSEFKRSRHRPLFVAITRPEDRDPALRGDVRVRDCETGDTQDVSITDAVLERYRAAYDEHFAALQSFVKQRQGGWLEIDADVDVMDQLATMFEGGRFVA